MSKISMCILKSPIILSSEDEETRNSISDWNSCKKSLKVKEREEGSHGAKRLGKEKQTTLHKQHKRKHGKV